MPAQKPVAVYPAVEGSPWRTYAVRLAPWLMDLDHEGYEPASEGDFGALIEKDECCRNPSYLAPYRDTQFPPLSLPAHFIRDTWIRILVPESDAEGNKGNETETQGDEIIIRPKGCS